MPADRDSELSGVHCLLHVDATVLSAVKRERFPLCKYKKSYRIVLLGILSNIHH